MAARWRAANSADRRVKVRNFMFVRLCVLEFGVILKPERSQKLCREAMLESEKISGAVRGRAEGSLLTWPFQVGFLFLVLLLDGCPTVARLGA